MSGRLKSSPRQTPPGSPVRDLVRTKKAILEAARTCFAAESYERVTTRQIAGAAGVNHSLISKYFGSKEGLFRELVAEVMHMDDCASIETEIARVAQSIASGGKGRHSARKVLFRSSGSPLAGKIFKEFLEDHYIPALSAQIDKPDARLRVELALSFVHGAIVFHRLGLSGLTTTSQEQLEQHLTQVLRDILGVQAQPL